MVEWTVRDAVDAVAGSLVDRAADDDVLDAVLASIYARRAGPKDSI